MEHQSENKVCQNCKNDFTIEPDDFSFYEKIKVPLPTFCPECRMIRRFNFRNEGMLFRRLDSSSEQESFSGYPPEAKIITYENSYWFSDKWNSDNNFLDYDWNENFFNQFKKLLEISPIPIKSVYNLINSDYCNEASELKNCYLCFNVDFLENSAYVRKTTHSKDVFDVYECAECELSYSSVILDKCYNTFFSYNCSNSFDVWFSKNLKNCSNCFACVNLIGKSYCIFNKQYSKKEYFKYIENLNLNSYKNFQKTFEEANIFHLKFPNKYFNGYRNLNSSGDKIYDTKNVKFSYSVRNGENLKYCQDIQPSAANSYDYTIWGHGENIYESIVCGLGVFNLKFCFNCWENAKDLEYCSYCLNSSNCFGCVGLRNKQYCIFNKQYSKENGRKNKKTHV